MMCTKIQRLKNLTCPLFLTLLVHVTQPQSKSQQPNLEMLTNLLFNLYKKKKDLEEWM
jgi:hypothetical protein